MCNMDLFCKYFGKFKYFSTSLNTYVRMNNGKGKTSIINAYYWLLTGKTLNGFVARNVHVTNDNTLDNQTSVTLSNSPFFVGTNVVEVTRVLNHVDGGTELYVNGLFVLQSDFVELLNDAGIDFELLKLCANMHVLTDNSLTSEKLRTFLSKTGMISDDKSKELRREQKDVRAKLKQAEAYALNTVTVPSITAEPLNASETTLYEEYTKQYNIIQNNTDGVPTCCPMCQRAYDAYMLNERRKQLDDARTFVFDNVAEYNRLNIKRNERLKQEEDAKRAQMVVDAAKRARNDVRLFASRLAEIEKEIRDADKNEIVPTLPKGMNVITESTAKNGNTRSACTLTYNDVPLKSINTAKRVQLCLEIVNTVLDREQYPSVYPIMLDNAESILSIDNKHNNVIAFYASKDV